MDQLTAAMWDAPDEGNLELVETDVLAVVLVEVFPDSVILVIPDETLVTTEADAVTELLL